MEFLDLLFDNLQQTEIKAGDSPQKKLVESQLKHVAENTGDVVLREEKVKPNTVPNAYATFINPKSFLGDNFSGFDFPRR